MNSIYSKEKIKQVLQNSKRYVSLNNLYKLTPLRKLFSASKKGKNKYHLSPKFYILQIPKKKENPNSNVIPKKLKRFVYLFLFGTFVYYNYPEMKEVYEEISKFDSVSDTKKFINNLLISEEIKGGGVELLESIIKNKHTKNATTKLLNNLLEDPIVLNETKNYGVSLVDRVLSEEELQLECKKLFVDLLSDQQIKKESADLLKYILEKEESKDILSQYFKVIFLREDIIQSLASVISDSANHSMDQTETKKKFGEFLIDVWSDPNLRWSILKKTLNIWPTNNKNEIQFSQENNKNAQQSTLENINVNKESEEKNK